MDGLDIDLSKTKYVHNPDLDAINEVIQALLVNTFDENVKLEGIAPNGLQVRSPIFPPDLGEDVLKFWTVTPNPSMDPIQSEWRIVMYTSKLPRGKAQKIAAQRPTHLLTRGGSAAMATSRANLGDVDLSEPWRKLNGYNFKCMLLMSPTLVDAPLQKIDSYEKVLATQVKRFYTELCYSIHLKLIRKCEMPDFDHDGKTFKQLYQLNAKLKSGAYATVCKGKHRETGKRYAIKCITRKQLQPWEEIDIMSEVSIMSTLEHEHIVNLVDFFEQEDCFLLVMELCDGGDLFDRIGQREAYNEKVARDLCKLFLESVRYCHEDMSVVHCDLKPRNLLLESMDDDISVKLADFGFATRVTAPKSITKRCGTPFFVAPEILKKKPYDQSADMWSVGIMIYLLIGGTMPFLGRNQKELFTAIIDGHYTFPDQYWENVSFDAKELIRHLLRTNPDERWTARQALESSWIRADGEALANVDLAKSAKELKLFNARLKFKAAIIGLSFLAKTKAMVPTKDVEKERQSALPKDVEVEEDE